MNIRSLVLQLLCDVWATLYNKISVLLSKNVVSRTNSFESHTFRIIGCVHWFEHVSNEDQSAEHPTHHLLTPYSLTRRSDNQLTRVIYKFDRATGDDDFGVELVTAGMTSPVRNSSRSIWRWGMFGRSAMTVRAEETRCLPWAQHLHGMRFNISRITYGFTIRKL